MNSDLKNLLESTQIATIFLDSELHIKNFTPAMTDLFHLRDSDRGRPITEIVTRMNYADLRRDVAKVLRTLTVIEHEVRIAEDETVFVMRIRPYRSVDNVIDGVVITFIDITERKRHEEAQARLAAIVESSQDAIIGHAFDGAITSWNAGAEAIFGYTAKEAIGKPFSTLIPENQKDEVPQLLDKLKRGERVDHFEIDRIRKDGKKIDVSLAISPIKDARGKMIAAATIARQFTERKAAEDHKSFLMAELDHRVKNTLMVITSLIAQTAKSSDSPEKFSEIIEGRIQALSRVHNLLNQNDWDRAALRDVIAGELAPYRNGTEENVVIDGNVRGCPDTESYSDVGDGAARTGDQCRQVWCVVDAGGQGRSELERGEFPEGSAAVDRMDRNRRTASQASDPARVRQPTDRAHRQLRTAGKRAAGFSCRRCTMQDRIPPDRQDGLTCSSRKRERE